MGVVWLSPEQVKDLNREALYEGEPHGLNPGSDLEGAINRPRGHYFYDDVSSLYRLATMYAFALVKAHAFNDGNKRTAFLSIRAFLWLNNLEFDHGPYDEEAAEIMTAIATGDIEEEEVEGWIRANTVGAS